MNSDEHQEEFDLHFPEIPASVVHFDFRPIKIRVYKNGDELDPGVLVAVTRREFKHWVVFLDGLTRKLKTTTAINKLCTLGGERIDHFEELDNGGEYVAMERGPFVQCAYGKMKDCTRMEKNWTSLVRVTESKPHFLESAESMDIYLKHEGYGTYTGLPYPLDGIVARSPSHSALHLSHLSHGKSHLGGSLEHLNKAGTRVWTEEIKQVKETNGDGKTSTVERTISMTKLPRLVGLEEEGVGTKLNESQPDEKQVEELKLPPIGLAVPAIARTPKTPTSPAAEIKETEEKKEEGEEIVHQIKLVPESSRPRESRIPKRLKVHIRTEEREEVIETVEETVKEEEKEERREEKKEEKKENGRKDDLSTRPKEREKEQRFRDLSSVDSDLDQLAVPYFPIAADFYKPLARREVFSDFSIPRTRTFPDRYGRGVRFARFERTEYRHYFDDFDPDFM